MKMVRKFIDFFSMFKQKSWFFAFLTIISCQNASAQSTNTCSHRNCNAYVSRFRAIAIEEQRRHGIPASLTLAQAILESGHGTSRVAREGHNHFGITANSRWRGDTIVEGTVVYRKYASDEASFRDHSLVLKSHYYTSVHGTDLNDFEEWANGIRRCGYAEDPRYSEKLIAIERSHNLGTLVAEAGYKPRRSVTSNTPAETAAAQDGKMKDAHGDKKSDIKKPLTQKPMSQQSKSTATVQSKTAATAPNKPTAPAQSKNAATAQTKPASPTPTASNAKPRHKVQQAGAAKFVVAVEGDSYYRISEEYGLNFAQLLQLNDIKGFEKTLIPGERVYITQKSERLTRGKVEHKVRNGETLWSIAQTYGVKLKTLLMLNEVEPEAKLKPGTSVKLR